MSPILIKKPGRYYAIREAARLTGAGVTTIAAAVASGALKAVRPEAPGAGPRAHTPAWIHESTLKDWAAGYRERNPAGPSRGPQSAAAKNKSRPPP